MNILVTGRGTSGSWACRGLQLGHAIGAHVEPQANSIKGYELAIVVKRCPADLLTRIRQRGVPIVYDIVDAWPQPDGNMWGEARAKEWLAKQIDTIRPVGIVAATEQMARDCQEFGVPVLHLPHHARPGQVRNEVRKEVRKVGYEGSLQHLGWWNGFLGYECQSRGIDWVINPEKLTDLDVVVAVRSATGYAPMNWKSGVKLANAQETATPCILARESGYIEMATGGEMWADTKEEMVAALDYLMPHGKRMAAHALLRSRDNALETVAKKYSKWLRSRF